MAGSAMALPFFYRYSVCQKNVPMAGGFFATTAYATILLFGTYL
jgi:hypothetical protein